MSVFCDFFCRYQEKIVQKNGSLILRLKKSATIKIVCNQGKINLNEQLLLLDFLYQKYSLKKHGFNNFSVTEIMSTKPIYDSIYLFISNRI